MPISVCVSVVHFFVLFFLYIYLQTDVATHVAVTQGL